MSEANKRILFLCAHRSIRALMVGSLLAAQTTYEWDIWMAPGSYGEQETTRVRQVLDEVHISVIASPQEAEPTFDRSWDEGIVLCSGVADQ